MHTLSSYQLILPGQELTLSGLKAILSRGGPFSVKKRSFQASGDDPFRPRGQEVILSGFWRGAGFPRGTCCNPPACIVCVQVSQEARAELQRLSAEEAALEAQ
eukprot:91884-Pelagomonas_calceolata.AAC.1